MNIKLHAGRRRVGQLLALAAVGAVLSGCAGLAGPRDVDIPLPKLQRQLEGRFPIQQRALAVFDLELSRPRLSLQRDNDRVALETDVSASTPLVRRALQGTVMLSGRLLVDNVRNAVVLADARIERFAIDGVDGALQGQLTAAGNVVIDRMVRDVPLYSFKPEDLRYGGVQFIATAIRTTPTGLSVRVEPAPAR
ncbi:DUF1439 domain-containing protein [Pseudoduganella buxea]|uniref:DUF1439 domain-containing protein n=1 Tax=Pseudoduganella buxea TaxID=1949069 RepID=A0A6I3SU36_9BURK|nr:DUF1439 domain-containing protein [Pseudoduganella buxea]MTV52700.1 DUF1439 domain-containing protein [Pseudoduganella buxea]GGC18810.1 hypothetical protein GCM10011572_45380 [Pseudoduganella buxea]